MTTDVGAFLDEVAGEAVAVLGAGGEGIGAPIELAREGDGTLRRDGLGSPPRAGVAAGALSEDTGVCLVSGSEAAAIPAPANSGELSWLRSCGT